MSKLIHLKTATLKASIVLIPSYSAAALTDKMVWVVPTLAASSFFAATIGLSESHIRRRVDEDDAEEEDADLIETSEEA